jgi:hypothetical protein
MFEQDRTFGEALSDKTKARFMGIKEKFTPLNIIRMLTGSGGIGRSIRTVAGRAMGYSEGDIQYFGGYKRKRSIYGADRSRVPAGSKSVVKVNDSTADILAKMYNLMRKIDEDNTRRYEKEQNFEEENILEDKKRHEKVLDALGAKNKKVPGKVEKPKEETDEKDGILVKMFGSIFGVFKKVFSFFKIVGGAIVSILEAAGALSALAFIGKLFKNPMTILGKILLTILPNMVTAIFAALRSPLTLLAAGSVFAVLDSIDKIGKLTKDSESLLAKTELPGPESVQSTATPHRRTQDALSNDMHGFTTETERNLRRELWDKENQKLYELPIYGSGGQKVTVALNHAEGKKLASLYENVKNANSDYEERKTPTTYNNLVEAHKELNDSLQNYFKRTYRTPDPEKFKIFKESIKGLDNTNTMFDKYIVDPLKEAGNSIAKETVDILEKSGLIGTKSDWEKAPKVIDKASAALGKLKAISPNFDIDIKNMLNFMESDQFKDAEEFIAKQKSSVMNLNQKNTPQQQSNLKGVEIRDTKLLESSSSK